VKHASPAAPSLSAAPPAALWLIRHAEVEARYQRVFGGRIDMDLSPRGHQQAAILADFLRRQPLAALYASPMKRVLQTLAPLLSSQLPPPIVLPALREADFGDWTGLGWDEVLSRFGVSAFDWLRLMDAGAIPNADSAQTLRARVEPCLRSILQAQTNTQIAIVCHGGVIRMVLAILLHWPLAQLDPFEIEYASLTQVAWVDQKPQVRLLNFTPWRELLS
jgi:broad specificity phosphatase PhoE